MKLINTGRVVVVDKVLKFDEELMRKPQTDMQL